MGEVCGVERSLGVEGGPVQEELHRKLPPTRRYRRKLHQRLPWTPHQTHEFQKRALMYGCVTSDMHQQQTAASWCSSRTGNRAQAARACTHSAPLYTYRSQLRSVIILKGRAGASPPCEASHAPVDPQGIAMQPAPTLSPPDAAHARVDDSTGSHSYANPLFEEASESSPAPQTASESPPAPAPDPSHIPSILRAAGCAGSEYERVDVRLPVSGSMDSIELSSPVLLADTTRVGTSSCISASAECIHLSLIHI